MKTIALRFADNFAPDGGTIKAHQQIIDRLGYSWYGKMGTRISDAVLRKLNEMQDSRILLIYSGKTGRYWA